VQSDMTEILYTAQNTEIWLPRMCAKYFRFLSKTNSALKITSAIRVPNLVKIGKKNCARYHWRKRTISLFRKSIAAHAHWLNPFWLWTVLLERHLSGSLRSKFGEDRLKIEGARDYRMHSLWCDPNVHTHTYTHSYGRLPYARNGHQLKT